jgi:hypothetical protein
MEAAVLASSVVKSIGLLRPWAVLAIALSGCATMTPEQGARRELLAQAAQDCQRRYPFIQSFEFDRFDRLLWYYREGTSAADRDLFRTCYGERVSELTRTAAASAPGAASGSRPPAQTPGTPAVADSWNEAPVWHVGDEWGYRWESPRGGGTFVWRVMSEETVDGADCYVIDAGRIQLYFRKTDLAFVQERDRGTVSYRYTPPRRVLAWPLRVGGAWEDLFVQEWPQERSTRNRLRAWRVEAKERITVPAGTFESFKIVERDKWGNSVVAEVWVAPAVRGMVRVQLHYDYGIEKRELTSFKLK